MRIQVEQIYVDELNTLEKLVNKTVLVKGVVTEASHKTSKRGKAFGVITILDESGEFEIYFFGVYYSKFKTYLKIDNQLAINLSIQNPFGDTFWYKIKSICYA